MSSRKDHQVLTIIVTFLFLAGCFFALAPSVRAADAPGQPTGLTATAGNGQVSLTWTAPSSDGGAVIDHYIVYQDDVDLGNQYTGTSAVITGLTNGQDYNFSVAAHNEAGYGPRTDNVTSTPIAPTVPGVPTGLAATAGNGQVSLNWTAPSSNGGATIDYYVVYRDGVDVNHSTGISVTVSGLTNGQQYNFTVAAHNSAGTGPQTSAVRATPVAATTAPGAPTSLQAIAGNGQVNLSWAAPASNGGSNITGFKVYRGTTAGGETLLANISNVLAYNDSSVTNGVTYYYQVSAVNAVGESSRSNEVSTTPVASKTVPSAPLALASAAGNGQVTLLWIAPSTDGGAAIDYYVVYRDGVDAGHISGTSTTIADLTNGQQYNFTVAAHNSVGIGPQSTAVTATPGSDITVPGAPTGLSVTPGDGQVTLSWTAPSDDGGARIDYYIVYQNGVDVAHPTSTSVVIAGLTNGQSYRFMVAAHNSAGTSAMTTSKEAAPEAGDNTQWWLIGVVVLIGALGVIPAFILWRKRTASPPNKPIRFDELQPKASVPETPAPITPAKVNTPLIDQLDAANGPMDLLEASALSRTTTPLADQLDAAKESEPSILCPRCGRPNSGRTKCAFCGKKLK